MGVTVSMGMDHRVMNRSDSARCNPILEAIAREHHLPGTANPVRRGPAEEKKQFLEHALSFLHRTISA
jgi:hypothetical protein